MARPTNDQRLQAVHTEALQAFDRVQSSSRDERRQSKEDRRFASITGAQWEGPWGEMFENKPKPEINKVQNALIRIENEYRNNRITVDFVAKDGTSNLDLADTCDGLYRADEQDSCAEEAYDNAFQEGTAGGMGAWRLKACYEDEEDDENEAQRIRFEPIFDADTSVFFDTDAKRQNKSDAKKCWVLYGQTPEDYMEEWDDDPASWPADTTTTEFDWCTPDIVYIAEYYHVEHRKINVRTFVDREGEEEKLTDDELEAMGEELAEVENYTRQQLIDLAIGDMARDGKMETKKRSKTVRKVHKYIMSGGKVLEDCGYIAGKYIPIIPFYGKRWFIDNIERFMGHVRLAKDVQRLKNLVVAWLGEIAAQGSIEKPILLAEQMVGHEQMWAEDNVKKYPYLLINPITSMDGQEMPSGPVSYTKAPAIPQAMAALLQILDIDMAEILGNQQNGDKMVSNISGKAVEMIQQRLDMQAFIYLSNFAKSMQWCGTVWLSMAKELYTEAKRKMKLIGEQANIESVELVQPIIDEEGNLTTRNDMSKADFDVVSDVGPSFTSRRDATVRALTGVLQMTEDPQDKSILNSLILMNMEGEGLNDVREFYRKKLVGIGVLQPNEEEKKQIEEAKANQQPNPQDTYLMAEAGKSEAQAEESRANTGLKTAQTVKTEAETVKILKEAGEPANA